MHTAELFSLVCSLKFGRPGHWHFLVFERSALFGTIRAASQDMPHRIFAVPLRYSRLAATCYVIWSGVAPKPAWRLHQEHFPASGTFPSSSARSSCPPSAGTGSARSARLGCLAIFPRCHPPCAGVTLGLAPPSRGRACTLAVLGCFWPNLGPTHWCPVAPMPLQQRTPRLPAANAEVLYSPRRLVHPDLLKPLFYGAPSLLRTFLLPRGLPLRRGRCWPWPTTARPI